MILSFLGSATAWLMNYSKVDDRVQKLHALDQLMDLIRAAREAPDVPALDRLQAEADDILQTAIQQVENNAVDQAGLQAFSLALQQTRGAIADRRTLLLAGSAQSCPRRATFARAPQNRIRPTADSSPFATECGRRSGIDGRPPAQWCATCGSATGVRAAGVWWPSL